MQKTPIKPVHIQEDSNEIPVLWAIIGASIVLGLLFAAAIDDDLTFKACQLMMDCAKRG
jgi:hypothetical protein